MKTAEKSAPVPAAPKLAAPKALDTKPAPEPVVDVSTRRLTELLAAEAVLREITSIDGDSFRTWTQTWRDSEYLATVRLAHSARTPDGR